MAVSLINNKSQHQKLNQRSSTFSSDVNSKEIGYEKEAITHSEKNMNKAKFTADITHHYHILKLLK